MTLKKNRNKLQQLMIALCLAGKKKNKKKKIWIFHKSSQKSLVSRSGNTNAKFKKHFLKVFHLNLR